MLRFLGGSWGRWRGGSGAQKRDEDPPRHRGSLEERSVPVRELNLVEHRGELRHPLPLRCDLKETAFGVPGDSGAYALRLALEETAGREER
jgi:hypothetical protein